MTTPVSSMILVAIGAFIGSIGAVFLKTGADRLEKNLMALLKNWPLAAGVTCYLLSTVFFIKALKNGELSVLYPLVSLSYVWTMLWSRIFFKEPITRNKVVAILFILAGVFCLGVGKS
jgi:drug/metabolite transporter (DMT)-like permease